MVICDDCFEEFVHPIFHELMEKNERFKEVYGGRARWDWDDVAVTLTFSDPVKSTVRIDVSVVGSIEGNSWQSSWANKNYDDSSRIGMDKVREFGEEKGYEALTSGFLEADEYTGWEITAIAAHLLNAPGAYRFPTDSGHVYLVYRNVEVIRADAENRINPSARDL